MNRAQRKLLRSQIEQHKFFWINDEASSENSFAVHDRRDGLNYGTSISDAESLKYLLKYGSQKWLESPHNGFAATI